MVTVSAASPISSSRNNEATFDSNDFSNNENDRQIDLSQLFSDILQTFGNLKNILSMNRDSDGGDDREIYQSNDTSFRQNSANNFFNDILESRNDQPGPIAKLFSGSSGVCFKTCGFEDIQEAAKQIAFSNSVNIDDGNISVKPLIFSKSSPILLSNNSKMNGQPPIQPADDQTIILSG
uniref:Uncharacterized protein n=1 Tax=Panagrolaimus davidi TaxID=227884 RepID=A0A914QBS9_9BILA